MKMTRYSARIEELICSPQGGINSLCGFIIKTEDGQVALCKRWSHSSQVFKLMEDRGLFAP